MRLPDELKNFRVALFICSRRVSALACARVVVGGILGTIVAAVSCTITRRASSTSVITKLWGRTCRSKLNKVLQCYRPGPVGI